MFFEIDGIVGLALLALWIYCVLDVIATDGALAWNLPKGVWLFVVIILPDVGSVAWLLLGRPERAGWMPGDTRHRKPLSTRFVVRGPDDDPGFTGRAGSAPSRPSVTSAPTTPAFDAQDTKRRELEAREADLKKQQLEMWEADLARREAEVQRKTEGPGGMYGA